MQIAEFNDSKNSLWNMLESDVQKRKISKMYNC